jgi:hypothetical protein
VTFANPSPADAKPLTAKNAKAAQSSQRKIALTQLFSATFAAFLCDLCG